MVSDPPDELQERSSVRSRNRILTMIGQPILRFILETIFYGIWMSPPSSAIFLMGAAISPDGSYSPLVEVSMRTVLLLISRGSFQMYHVQLILV
ncbi:MAG: hypothetical protein JXA22_03165 [Candidatus Thermoplasmatota archaeon]|nr:hypothetical protein [Candidatus Thermoplasmatota archaeon]